MSRDNWVLLVALGLSMWMALRRSALGEARTLVPCDPKDPAGMRDGDRIAFLVRPVTALGAWQTLAPRQILAMMLFPLWAVFLDLLAPGRGDFAAFQALFGTWFAWVMLVTGHLMNILLWLIFMISTLFCFLTYLFWGETARAFGIGVGLMFGTGVGLLTALNYLALLHDNLLELRLGHTHDGRPLRGFRRWKKRAGMLLLLSTPLMVAYELLRPWLPEIDLVNMAAAEAGFSLKRYALLLAAYALGMNVCLSTIPLFCEMLERISIFGAGNYNKLWLKQQHPPIQPGKGGEILEAKDYVDAEGKWEYYGTGQVFPLYAVGLFFALNGFYQSADKLVEAGVYVETAMPTLKAGGKAIGTVNDFLGGIILVANVWFLVTVVCRMFGLRGNSAGTAEAMAEATKKPGLMVVTDEIMGLRLAFQGEKRKTTAARK